MDLSEVHIERFKVLDGTRPHLHGVECEEGLILPSELRIILEENHHFFLIVEHRPNERARDMAQHVAQAMKQASRGGILLYAPDWTGTWKPWPRRPGRRSSRLLPLNMQGAGLQPRQRYLRGDGKPDHPGSHEMALVAQVAARRTSIPCKFRAQGIIVVR